MLVVLALVFGAIAGAAAHYALPLRSMRGASVGAILGALLGTGTWTALTWAGMGPDSGWIWLLSIAVPVIVVPIALLVVSRLRAARDARTQRELGIA
ncbi:hypothetical protein ACH0CG_10685 [Microbacterium sp. 179-I 1D1 NHS]|uniref:hypothetical protein n=1 Tax=Microbacterium sp. 179-I 1D1 NHS TaxID=3374298 RepID=UPI0038794834